MANTSSDTREDSTHGPASWEFCVQVKKQQVELDMEQQTGSRSGKEYVKAVYLPWFILYSKAKFACYSRCFIFLLI